MKEKSKKQLKQDLEAANMQGNVLKKQLISKSLQQNNKLSNTFQSNSSNEQEQEQQNQKRSVKNKGVHFNRELQLRQTKVFLLSDSPVGSNKHEDGTTLAYVDRHHFIHMSPDELGDIQERKFIFDDILPNDSSQSAKFKILVMDLLTASIDLSTENTVLFYEKFKIDELVKLVALNKEQHIEGKKESQRDFSILKSCLWEYFEIVRKRDMFYMKVSISVAFLDENCLLDCFAEPEDEQQPASLVDINNNNTKQNNSSLAMLTDRTVTSSKNESNKNEQVIAKTVDGYKLKEISMPSWAEAQKVIDYVNNVCRAYIHMKTLIIQINFDKEITKYGKIVHRPRGRLNLVCTKGEGNIDLGKFLSPEQNEIDSVCMDHYVEKSILHIMSVNFMPSALAFPNTLFCKILSPMFEKSDKKDFVFMLDFQKMDINESVNELLFCELTKDVSQSGGDKGDSDDDESGSGSDLEAEDKIPIQSGTEQIIQQINQHGLQNDAEVRRLQMQLEEVEIKRQIIHKQLERLNENQDQEQIQRLQQQHMQMDQNGNPIERSLSFENLMSKTHINNIAGGGGDDVNAEQQLEYNVLCTAQQEALMDIVSALEQLVSQSKSLSAINTDINKNDNALEIQEEEENHNIINSECDNVKQNIKISDEQFKFQQQQYPFQESEIKQQVEEAEKSPQNQIELLKDQQSQNKNTNFEQISQSGEESSNAINRTMVVHKLVSNDYEQLHLNNFDPNEFNDEKLVIAQSYVQRNKELFAQKQDNNNSQSKVHPNRQLSEHITLGYLQKIKSLEGELKKNFQSISQINQQQQQTMLQQQQMISEQLHLNNTLSSYNKCQNLNQNHNINHINQNHYKNMSSQYLYNNKVQIPSINLSSLSNALSPFKSQSTDMSIMQKREDFNKLVKHLHNTNNRIYGDLDVNFDGLTNSSSIQNQNKGKKLKNLNEDADHHNNVNANVNVFTLVKQQKQKQNQNKFIDASSDDDDAQYKFPKQTKNDKGYLQQINTQSQESEKNANNGLCVCGSNSNQVMSPQRPMRITSRNIVVPLLSEENQKQFQSVNLPSIKQNKNSQPFHHYMKQPNKSNASKKQQQSQLLKANEESGRNMQQHMSSNMNMTTENDITNDLTSSRNETSRLFNLKKQNKDNFIESQFIQNQNNINEGNMNAKQSQAIPEEEGSIKNETFKINVKKNNQQCQ